MRKIRIQIVFLYATYLFLVSCSGLAKKSDVNSGPNGTADERNDYQQAMENYNKKNYQAALLSFESFIKKYDISERLLPALFQSGLSLQALSRWEDALDRFKTVARLTEQRAPMLHVESIYQLSICHEALGNDEKVVATLLDVKTQQQFLRKEVLVAELPARIAAAYVRAGNENEANKYYLESEKGLRQLENEIVNKKQPPVWYLKLLYNMGYLAIRHISVEKFEDALKPLDKAQRYLLRIIEFNDKDWAPLAAEKLINAYENAWGIIQNIPVQDDTDRLYALKNQQEKMKNFAFLLRPHLEQLRQKKVPELDNLNIQKLFAFTLDLEKRIEFLIAEPPIEQGLTLEAQKRQDPIIRGKLVDPEKLEKRKK